MATIFSEVPIQAPNKSMFQLNHDVKLTLEQGYLVPILCQDVLPGDHWKVGVNAFVRFMPMIAPVMQRFDIKVEAFFVPNRLIWSNWETFITGGPDGDDNTHPYPEFRIGFNELQDHYFTNGSLADYLGFPTVDPQADFNEYFGSDNGITVDAIPFKAYQLIYNEYYRDQNLTDEVNIYEDNDGVFVNPAEYRPLMTLRKRAWKKDYFTSSLPFVQRGTDVLLPIGNPATPINFEYNGSARVVSDSPLPTNRLLGAGLNPGANSRDLATYSTVSSSSSANNLIQGSAGFSIDNSNSLFADTTNTQSSINEHRVL